MLILIINCGSSSVKLALFQQGNPIPVATGMVDRIGTESISGSYRIGSDPSQEIHCQGHGDHAAALDAALGSLRADPSLKNFEVGAVGHRVVHGGQKFSVPALVTAEVLVAIRDLAPLAPVHAIPNALGIEAAIRLFPGVPQVAVFDTAFHQTIAPQVYRYAIPDEFYQRYQIRRYGFHGTSHAYVAEEAARRLNLDLKNSKLLSAHLGNGCSATAILNGESVDTSMGLTPLEGLVMGTRSGNVDPNLHSYLSKVAGLTLDEITDILNQKSGLIGLSGISNDLRTLTKKYHEGSEAARLAIDVFCFRLARELAGLTVALSGAPDALIFTGGIGENSCLVREKTLNHLTVLGFKIDPALNQNGGAENNGIITTTSPTAIVIATNEEFAIARATSTFCS